MFDKIDMARQRFLSMLRVLLERFVWLWQLSRTGLALGL